MFDPQTANLIRQVPPLPDLNRERLPEELTRAFTTIVSFRLRLATAGAQAGLPNELRIQLDQFRRMAATYESMVALLPERQDRRSAAFVAAQAHHLLHLAREAIASGASRPLALRPEAIAPEISALLLFLIANQPSDAAEMARKAQNLRPEGNSATAMLVDALFALGTGNLQRIPEVFAGISQIWPTDSCDAAAEALYRRILEGLERFARFVLDAAAFPRAGTDAITIFRQVQGLSTEMEAWPIAGGGELRTAPISAFAGPHHLACLLISAADFLGASALSAIPSPPNVPTASWAKLLPPIIERRPFLWPNHLEALSQGFLTPGTSAVVSFPTGAGKTTLSELKTASILALGRAVIQLAPTHALVAQTKADLKRAFPGVPVRDSLLVEDFYTEIGETLTVNNAQIIVMTPERCLALLSLETEHLDALGLVIFDECHLLHPKEQGQNRRSLDAMLAVLHLNRAAPDADWLLLSAMMSNASEISGWLADLTGRPCLALDLNWKPTRQARGCLVYGQAELDQLRLRLRGEAQESYRAKGKLTSPTTKVLDSLHAYPFGFFGLQQTWQSRKLLDYTLLKLLEKPVALGAAVSKGKPPTWYPTPNKNGVASEIAAQCVRLGLKVLLFIQSPRDTSVVARSIDERAADCITSLELTDDEKRLLQVAIDEFGAESAVLRPSRCAGCHHSNLLSSERELSESLFRRSGGIKALAATATLAQGMNLPADVVLIVGDERFDAEAEEFSQVGAHELLNAAGRAGRAGLVAQGLVIVIPHTFVGFDSRNREIGPKWLQLREAVFSQADQCLPIVDPIQHMLDKIQDAGSINDPEVRYFLRRVPRGPGGSPDIPSAFLQSTFAAWRAKKAQNEAQFMRLIESALLRRNDIAGSSRAETWRDELSYRTGIAIEFIEALHEELLRILEKPPSGTEAWIRWFFQWLASEQSRLDAVLTHRLPSKLMEQFRQGDLFGGKLADAVWGWMSGETLIALNTRLGGKTKPGICEKARKFVLKIIPDLAYTAGLATRIRRLQIEEDGGEMPIELATLALCIREGLAKPEIAALRINLVELPMSRRALNELWQQINGFARASTPTETFGRTMLRVRRAYRIAQSQGLI